MISRRDLLRTVPGAIAFMGMQRSLPELLTSERTGKTKIKLGACAGFFSVAHADVPAINDRRVYYDTPNTWPSHWPTVGDSTSTLSIRPYPGDLVAGKLDAQLRSLIQTAPLNSRLACFHECSNLVAYTKAPWLHPDGSRIVTAESMQRVHSYMKDFLRTSGNNPHGVAYGVIMCCPPDQMAPWMAGGLDWYGLDIYDWPQFHIDRDMSKPLDVNGALSDRFRQWHQVCQKVSGKSFPHMNICETNSIVPSHRPQWFTACASLLGSFVNGHVMDTFWSSIPDKVGPWLHDDKATISALNLIG